MQTGTRPRLSRLHVPDQDLSWCKVVHLGVSVIGPGDCSTNHEKNDFKCSLMSSSWFQIIQLSHVVHGNSVSLLSSLDFPARQPDESLLSSDLSIELSHHEEQRLSSSVQEDEESSDDGELPSFLMRADNSERDCSRLC